MITKCNENTPNNSTLKYVNVTEKVESRGLQIPFIRSTGITILPSYLLGYRNLIPLLISVNHQGKWHEAWTTLRKTPCIATMARLGKISSVQFLPAYLHSQVDHSRLISI